MDTLLITHGAYIPVELLLALGRVSFADYEAWRCGERPTLQSAVVGNQRRVLELLESAAAWAARLGLEPEPQVYHGWGANAGARLSFCDPEWQASEPLLATHYVRRAADTGGGQFDLFLDSGATAALADLRAALLARDARAAERALATFVTREPGHSLRPAVELLTDALSYLEIPLHRQAAEAELRAIEERLLPAARDVLGAQARDLLAPFWRRLAAALADAPFAPDRPRLHASHAYACALDWPRVIASIEAVPDHTRAPALLERMGEALHRNGQRTGAVAAWCMLCWSAPEAAAECLDAASLPDVAVREAWQEFLELDAQPDTQFFPAFLLLRAAGLAQRLPEDLGAGTGARDCAGARAFQAMRELMRADSTEGRRIVHAAAPWLLEAYLERRKARP